MFRVAHQLGLSNAHSPFRVVEHGVPKSSEECTANKAKLKIAE